jgi:hypothetical protein
VTGWPCTAYAGSCTNPKSFSVLLHIHAW